MRVKTLKRFKDKHSGKVHKENEIFTVSKERYEETLKVGKLVEEVKEDTKNAAK